MSSFLHTKYQALEAYTPGEQPRDKQYIKLNTNESPYPPSQAVLTALGEEDIRDLRLYSDPEGKECARYFYEYPAEPGLGHFLHTYVGDGNPLPTFQGEPERMAIPQDIDELTQQLWESLNEENRISLYVRMVDLESGRTERRLINKNALGGARRGE